MKLSVVQFIENIKFSFKLMHYLALFLSQEVAKETQ